MDSLLHELVLYIGTFYSKFELILHRSVVRISTLVYFRRVNIFPEFCSFSFQDTVRYHSLFKFDQTFVYYVNVIVGNVFIYYRIHLEAEPICIYPEMLLIETTSIMIRILELH